jgi:hypothetical protein
MGMGFFGVSFGLPIFFRAWALVSSKGMFHHCISAVQCLAGMKKMVLQRKTKNGKMKV